jgi:hypothetical protein
MPNAQETFTITEYFKVINTTGVLEVVTRLIQPVLHNRQPHLPVVYPVSTDETLTPGSQRDRHCLTQVGRWRHSVSDVVEYVITVKVTRIYFQHTSCVHTPVGNSNTLGLYWLITSYLEAFFLKERMNTSDSLYKLGISHRTRAFLKFKMAAKLSRLLYLELELLCWPLHSVKRKPLLAQLINCHNNRGKNVYSILPCLREMNRINTQFVYISIDTTYNRFPYMAVFVKRWFMTIFNVYVNMSRVLLRLVWHC